MEGGNESEKIGIKLATLQIFSWMITFDWCLQHHLKADFINAPWLSSGWDLKAKQAKCYNARHAQYSISTNKTLTSGIFFISS